jgi:hypothetical protein
VVQFLDSRQFSDWNANLAKNRSWCLNSCMVRSNILLLSAFAVVTLIGGQAAVPAQTEGKHVPQKLTAMNAQHILAGQCELLPTTGEFPDRLKAAFAKITKQNKFSLANPDEDYQATDFVEDPKLPFRRLVIAGKCEEFWFIHYEQGGRGHSNALVLFQDEPSGEASFVWGGRGGPRSNTREELRRAIADGLISDSLPFYW